MVGLIQFTQIARGEHTGVGHDDHVGQAVAGLELPDDRNHRRGLGFVAFEAADLQREPAAVHEQTDNDLRVDAAFLGVPDFA